MVRGSGVGDRRPRERGRRGERFGQNAYRAGGLGGPRRARPASPHRARARLATSCFFHAFEYQTSTRKKCLSRHVISLKKGAFSERSRSSSPGARNIEPKRNARTVARFCLSPHSGSFYPGKDELINPEVFTCFLWSRLFTLAAGERSYFKHSDTKNKNASNAPFLRDKKREPRASTTPSPRPRLASPRIRTRSRPRSRPPRRPPLAPRTRRPPWSACTTRDARRGWF